VKSSATLIVSLNPAIDCEWRVKEIYWEEKNNILQERRWAGGKGANVARWLKHLGGKPQLLIPLGGSPGIELAGYLRRAKIECRTVRLKQPTRVNVIVTSERGGQMRFNPLGPVISASEWRQLLQHVRSFCNQHRTSPETAALVLSGALPRGIPETGYREIIRVASGFGITSFLDCDGEPFKASLEARPFLVKPNTHELAQWWGKPIKSERDLRCAVCKVSDVTGGWVLVSRSAEGALLWSSTTGIGFSGIAPRVPVLNTVGAGDALLAAVVRQVHIKAEPSDWLRWGVATGTACVQNEGGKLATHAAIRSLADRVDVRSLR